MVSCSLPYPLYLAVAVVVIFVRVGVIKFPAAVMRIIIAVVITLVIVALATSHPLCGSQGTAKHIFNVRVLREPAPD